MSRRDRGPADLFFRMLVRALPPAFRRRFGPEIAETLSAGYQEARRRGLWARARFLLVAVTDLLVSSARQRVGGANAPRAGSATAGGRDAEGKAAELAYDLGYALRRLTRTPGFTLVAAVTLALALGATVVTYSAVRSILLEPLKFDAPGELVAFWPTRPQSPASIVAYRDTLRSYRAMAGWSNWGLTFNDPNGSIRLQAVRATANYFDVLGVEAELGRTFAPDEDQPGRSLVAVLGHGLWLRRFGGDEGVVGRTLRIDGVPHEVVGVMPAEFSFPRRETEIWLPYEMSPQRGDYRAGFMNVVARLRTGTGLELAQAELDALTARIRAAYPQYPDYGIDAKVVPLREAIVDNVRATLWLLMGAVGALLLLAAANLAVLQLGRALNRTSETAILGALGAPRWRLIRQMVSEGMWVALIGGGVGVSAAFLGVKSITAVFPPETPRLAEVGVDGTALALGGLLTLATGLVLGLLPALSGAGLNIAPILRTQRTQPLESRRLASALVVAELTFVVALLLTAGLLAKSFHRLNSMDPGLDAQRALVSRLSPPRETYQSNPELSRQLFDEILSQVRSLPGVTRVGMVQVLPMAGTNRRGRVILEGAPTPDGDDTSWAEFRVAGGDYFQALGIPLRAGRAFLPTDDASSTPVAIVNQEFARRYWGDQDPVGRRLQVPLWRDTVRHTVVGVVGTVRHEGLGREGLPEVYIPRLQYPRETFFHLVTRSDGRDPGQLASEVRNRIWSIDPEVAVDDLGLFEEIMASTIARPRLLMRVLAVFAGAAAILGSLGIYSVMAFRVRRRRREIAIRMAVGADRTEVRAAVVREALLLATAGTGLGLAGALAAQRVLSGFLYGVRPTDPWTLATVVAGAWLLALAASWIPAARASSVPPAEVLE